MGQIFYFFLLIWIDNLYSTNISIKRLSGIDIISDKTHKIKSADVYAEKEIYFLVVLENGHSLLKALNYSQSGSKKLVDVLEFPVQSAQSVAVDWVNGNLYWADKINRFFEVVDINHGLRLPIGKQKRRILFSQEIADIDSMVIDPWEQYIFWLHIGADMAIERAKLNGQDRQVIHQSMQYKSSSLAIDQHTKMLFWLGIDATIHRVDYQGRTGCSMQLEGDWKNWKPSFFVFSESRLIFITNGVMWTTVFTCNHGVASHVDAIRSPAAIIAVGYQLARPGKSSNQCLTSACQSLCLPSSESQHQCTCSTGISYRPNKSPCPDRPSKSLFIGSPPRIYQLSLEVDKMHMDPIYEESGIPFQLAYDPYTSSIYYVDYNSTSIRSLPIGVGYRRSQPLIFDSPVLFQAPSTFAIDSPARNIYWMNYQTNEVWVARITPTYRLKNTALLLSWKIDSFSSNRLHVPHRGRQAPLPGELAVDSNYRFLFVSVIRDGLASIERYWLDGTNKFVVLQSPDIISPRGLTIDSRKQELYFVDTTRDEMISVGYNGNHFRVISKKFPDFFGLTFLDGYVYWTDIETLNVNKIRSDGMYRSTVVSTHNLRAATMPIVAVSKEFNSTTVSPCLNATNVCDQLCFPTPGANDGYSCGCSNPSQVLLNMSRCTHHGRLILMFNSSYIKLQYLLSSTKNRRSELIFEHHSQSNISSVVVDRFRNFVYWIDTTNNCIMRTVIDNLTNIKTTIFCLTVDKIMSITIDANRNNLYVSIKSAIWSRIEIIRLPFPNADTIWRKVVLTMNKDSPLIGSIVVHSMTKRIFWLAREIESKANLVRIYQAELNGTRPVILWRGLAEVDQLVVSENGLSLFWRSSQPGIVFQYDLPTRAFRTLQLPSDIITDAISSLSSSSHIYTVGKHLYILQNSLLFQVNISANDNSVPPVRIKLSLDVLVPTYVGGFAIFLQNISSKMALIKSDMNLGSVVMCPSDSDEGFSVCTQFCLPSPLSDCSCGSPYSLKQDGHTCGEINNHLLVLTSSGEVIGLEMVSRPDRQSELAATEWIEIPEHRGNPGQRFIDAIYWTSKNIILLLDNEGQLIGKHRSWPYHKTKIYKNLSIMNEDNDPLKMSSTYEKAYKHFLAKDQPYLDRYESSRYSITLDPISDTLIWSDWVNGVIVTEKLNSNKDSVDYLGIVVDFRHSSRRPLKVTVAPISGSLVWISADLSITGSSDSSFWRHFWIELSDMDGSRRTVLIRDLGVPYCLTVDVHTGRIYWIDKQSNMLMYLHVHWDSYKVKAGHVLGLRLKVTVNSILTTGIGRSSSAMTVLKRHLVWTDWFQQIVASASLDATDVNLHIDRMNTEKIQVFEFVYVKHKLKKVVKLIERLGSDDFRTSSVGTFLQNHPCSHEMSDNNGQLCSHLCLSTIPISLVEPHSNLMTTKQLDTKYRCACPHDMSVQYQHKRGVCIKTTFVLCGKNEFVCRAGRFFDASDKQMTGNCINQSKQCDVQVDCLDGSDESGCGQCNISHPYSCSASGRCLERKNRCDGTADCDSDELCCDSQKFECLTGSGASRCISVTERCNGVRNCIDGSDESGCSLPDNKPNGVGNIRDNYLVAIVTGFVALLACSVAIIYICVSRRSRNKTVHESCMFRANNVNIMLMSNTARAPRHSRPHRSHNNMSHAQSCDIIDVYKSHHDSDHLSHSLTSLSDIYQRIRDPHPDRFSALKIPLFTIQDDVLFNFNRFRRPPDPYTSSDSNEKFENPPPSEVTANSEESVNFINHNTATDDNVARSSEMISPCESELEEIYFHRYRSYGNRSPNYQNYPSRLLQMLLTSNHSNYLQDSRHSIERGQSQPRHDHQRRKKSMKHHHQKRRKPWKTNLSLSPRRKLYCSHESLALEPISPPPPSPITVVST